MRLLEQFAYLSEADPTYEYSNQKSAYKIKQVIEQNESNYEFTNNYTDNELQSVCIHLVSERDLLLSKKHKNIGKLLPQEMFMFLALFLMQNEKNTKRLGIVIEAYWALSNEYLLFNKSNEQIIQYYDVNDENILDVFENKRSDKNNVIVFGISDNFMQAVHQCDSWEFNRRHVNSQMSAVGLMKLILNFQLTNKDVYFYYEDTALANGLKKENISSLINPRVTLQINKVNPALLRRVSMILLRIIDNLEELPQDDLGPLDKVFAFQIIGWDKLNKQQSKWMQTKNGNIYRNKLIRKITNYLYFSSTQISKEKQSKIECTYNYEDIITGIENECGEKNWIQLKGQINQYGMRSKKILSCSVQTVLEVQYPEEVDRYNNRLVQIEIKKHDSAIVSRLLEEHQKNWREDVYLSKVNN